MLLSSRPLFVWQSKLAVTTEDSFDSLRDHRSKNEFIRRIKSIPIIAMSLLIRNELEWIRMSLVRVSTQMNSNCFG